MRKRSYPHTLGSLSLLVTLLHFNSDEYEGATALCNPYLGDGAARGLVDVSARVSCDQGGVTNRRWQVAAKRIMDAVPMMVLRSGILYAFPANACEYL